MNERERNNVHYRNVFSILLARPFVFIQALRDVLWKKIVLFLLQKVAAFRNLHFALLRVSVYVLEGKSGRKRVKRDTQ